MSCVPENFSYEILKFFCELLICLTFVACGLNVLITGVLD